MSERREEALRKYKLFEQALQNKGINTAEVCRKSHVDPSTFSRWKQGDYTPKIDKLLAIAKALDVDVGYFLNDK